MSTVSVIKNPAHASCDNAANEAGYTAHMIGTHSSGVEICILIRPEVSLDDLITAFDTDEQEWVLVKAWEFEWEWAA